MGHEVFVLEEARRASGPARWLTREFSEPQDGISTLWYDPRRGLEKLMTWPVDRLFKRSFEGRNLAHRILLVRAAVKRFNPDVVVASDGFTYAIPAAFLRRMGILTPRLVVSYIGGDILDSAEAEVGKRRTGLTDWLIRSSLSAPDVLRPVSPLMRQQLVTDGADAGKIKVIPSHLVTSSSELEDIARRRESITRIIRSRYALPESAPVVITLGGNQKGKGLQVLAKAWPRVLAAIPEARWLLCGPESRWIVDVIRPMIVNLGIEASVVYTGRLHGRNVFEHLAASDLHVNPSLCESLNMVTVEAAAVGTPTLSSDAAGISHWLIRYGAGEVVRSGQVEPLADAIIRSIRAASTLFAWSQAGLALASEFSLDRIARELLACFRPDPESSR